ncbi:MAG: DUF3135 domain-containing protein [Gammaproteobacteria bacterium]|nr:DUF3135 domain-containing protein [Gammaproteobacteria bacterium]
MTQILLNDFNFEEWVNLATSDPDKFEKLRRDKISALIESVSAHNRQRLHGLQWQLDIIREKNHNSAMAACFAISKLMWETLDELAIALHSRSNINSSTIPDSKTAAEIIAFPSTSRQK